MKMMHAESPVRYRRSVLMTVLLVVASVGSSEAQTESTVAENAVLGVWATEPNEEEEFVHVEVYRCDDRYCGRIVWLSHPLYEDTGKWGVAGNPQTDWKNPDEELQGQALQNLELLHSFRFDDGKWKDGRIYDPDNGKTYHCELTLAEDSEVLKVRGYVKVLFVKVGRTTEWTRVPEQQ